MTRSSNAGGIPARDGAPAPDVEVVCLGESMVTFLPRLPGRLADVPSFDRAIGGAESNVACTLARTGHSARWISRVGADGFGDHLLAAIADCGVDVTHVRRDPLRPTGIYFRTAGDRATDTHEVAYYRAGSAASAMTAAHLDRDAVHSGRILHLSGITAALSEDCLGLMCELTARRPGRPLLSFDVNYRPGLWREPSRARALLELARGADLVFVGDDEARDAWGLHGARAISEALPEPDLLVVKQGKRGATVFQRTPETGAHRGDASGTATGERCGDASGIAAGERRGDASGIATGMGRADATATFVPSLNVDLVAATGAGDAFAAGFLSATLRALPVRTRIRHGHLWAAAALTVPGDLATPPGRAHADRLADLDDAAWERLHLGPGWTEAAASGRRVDASGRRADASGRRADEEVRTP
ncbi:2-dehydro-3-deoxygluconokinase [Streptomyces sp. 2112.3]|nr:sugar kinase [Streptomyces sp. 2112.3]SEE42693.1 2-dehydro-3-deoxygluconokinase [Streptomyces sp. 2112.3]